MTEFYTEEQTVKLVARLTRTRLVTFIESDAITPARSDAGLAFRRSDLARLELMCELADFYGMEPEALAVTISVIDQLHATRADLRALLGAIREEPPEIRARIAAKLGHARPDTGWS